VVLEAFLDKLSAVRRQPNGQYSARCPAHDDRHPSLSVTATDDEILVFCHARHCTSKEICAALGLTVDDLRFTPRSPSRNLAEPTAVYDYHDESGRLLFQSLRYDDPKTFRQRHLDAETGEWVYNMQDVPRVLYGLPEVIQGVSEGRTVYVVEGERDVESIRATGHVATCNPMGAGKWRDEYAEVLTGANVIIVADRDEPGRNHAERIRQTLIGKARGIWMMQAKVGKDVTDHLEAGHPLTALVIRKQRSRTGIVTAHEMALAGVEELNARPSDLPSYRFSPALPLEFRGGRIYSVGAYTSDGKTRFGLQGFRSLAEAGVHVGYFTLEMPERGLRNILVAHRGVPLDLTEHPWRLKRDGDKLALYHQALEEIGGWTADVVFESGMNADKIIEYTRDREYDVIVVDHLHRFSWGERRDLETQVQKLTNLALDANVCVVMMCQLRRHNTNGYGGEAFPEPTIADFKETSVIEQESSMCLAIWRKRVDGILYGNETRVRVLKNRHTTNHNDRAGRFWEPPFDESLQRFLASSDEQMTYDGPRLVK